MADLSSITAVRPTQDTVKSDVVYGATVAVGDSLYKDTADDDEWKPADANSSAITAGSGGVGIAMTAGVDGSYGVVATGGKIVLVGATMAVGTTYFVSPTAGKIMPEGDKATGDFVTNLGTASTATQLDLFVKATGSQVP